MNCNAEEWRKSLMLAKIDLPSDYTNIANRVRTELLPEGLIVFALDPKDNKWKVSRVVGSKVVSMLDFDCKNAFIPTEVICPCDIEGWKEFRDFNNAVSEESEEKE